MTKLLCIISLLCLTGCAVEPSAIRVGAEHLSSISQHFGDNRMNLGINAATLSATWRYSHAYLELQEAYILNDASFAGHKEYFEAHGGYEFELK